jgi:hypothetical protein
MADVVVILSMVCGSGVGAVVTVTGMVTIYCKDAIMFADEHALGQYEVVHGKQKRKKQTIRGKGCERRDRRCGRTRRRRRRCDGVPW